MAKIKLGAGIQDARGSINGTTYSKNASGAYIRAKVSPVQPQTSFQLQVRANFSFLAKRWSTTLTDAQREAWNAFAVTHPIVDVFGDTMQLSGINTYLRLNQILKQVGSVAIDVPPADLNVTSLLTVTATIVAATSYDVAFTPTPLAVNERSYVWSSGPVPNGKEFTKNLYRQITSGVTNASPTNAQGAYTTRFGTSVVGQRISTLVSVVNIATGAVSPGLKTLSTVT